MADPKMALASIGKFHRKRTNPPPAIKAIQNDLIKVNFDPSKAAARLVLLVPKARAKSSQVVHTPTTSRVDIEARAILFVCAECTFVAVSQTYAGKELTLPVDIVPVVEPNLLQSMPG
ncbi:hypothetical protein ElyMa_007068900 [Elysia marginata]|uniref:Uncharacterized protein n=1 Tax=Elysia marginata TaxID=1093978 RepID=A0AAV4JZD7_9GAST|nr:hypothetical protein ElyMa_007068900 [Elysia marginata]